MRARIPRLVARVSWSAGKFVLTYCFLQVARHSGKCHRLIMGIGIQVYQEACDTFRVNERLQPASHLGSSRLDIMAIFRKVSEVRDNYYVFTHSNTVHDQKDTVQIALS